MRKINLEEEREFENSKVNNNSIRSSQSKYYWSSGLSIEYHQNKIYNLIQDCSILEIGCSSGLDATNYVQYCENYVGIDISDVGIEKAKKRGLDKAEFICSDGHQLPVGDNEVDYVIVSSLLHHMDLKEVLLEIDRVLKKDGGLIFREPLGTNPLFQLYRLLTPKVRTIDERPFTFHDLKLIQERYVFTEVQWFGFTSIISAFIRYDWFRLVLTKFDSYLSYTPLKYLFWQISGVLRKK